MAANTRSLFRVNFAVCQRSRGGDAVKLSAYNSCNRLSHGERKYDFRRKHAEHVGRTVLLTPEGYPRAALGNPGALWRAAEAAENRGNSCTARQVLLTIPRECPTEHRAALVRHVVAPWVEQGMAAQIDLHDPSARDGDEQPHAHILLTVREFEGDGFAKTKTRGREWEAAFRDQKSRTMRGQVADRMNGFFRDHGLAITVDARTNLKIDGSGALPPEPQVPRADIEATKRNPASPPAAVVQLDEHRAAVRRVRDFDVQLARAEAHAAQLRTAIATPINQETTTMTSTIADAPAPAGITTTATTPWTQQEGLLSPDQLAAARVSYEKWRTAQLRRGRSEETIYGFDRYVSFIQDKQTTRGPRPADGANAAFVRRARPDPEPGFDRRKRFLADLLAQHYDLGKLDASVADNIQRIKIDREAKTATVFLRDGSSFIDHGDRIQFHGSIAAPSAAEIAAAAARHGWTKVALTGSAEFKDEVAIALAMREPPIEHDHQLTPAAAARLRRVLAERANASTISPETSHAPARSFDAVRPAAVAPAPRAAASGDAPGRRLVDGVGGNVAVAGGDGAGAGARDAGSGDSGGGLEGAADEDVRAALIRWLAPRVATAQAYLASRPPSVSGTSRAARTAQARQQEFDAGDLAVRARTTVATHQALNAGQDADLIQAVRATNDPAAAERALAARADIERRQQLAEASRMDAEHDRRREEAPSI